MTLKDAPHSWVKAVVEGLQQPRMYLLKLFSQLDCIKQFMRLLRDTSALNKILVLERLFLGYAE